MTAAQNWGLLEPLNAICPYFTMFPLSFPLTVLTRSARLPGPVLDPFCGRGTTTFAARMLGLPSVGVDSSPVAVAVTAAKTVSVRPSEIVSEARSILAQPGAPEVPQGQFWELAFAPDVLRAICTLRDALLVDAATPARMALRGLMLGALHGPIQKVVPGYFSNQAPRTYAPKPGYAVKFWSARRLQPPRVDPIAVIDRRAQRYYAAEAPGLGVARHGDSRDPSALEPLDELFQWVITSPPYYGMRTYVADQWLRMWFLGGPDHVDYAMGPQVRHSSPDDFASDLRTVWRNAAQVAHPDAELTIRFGAIRDRTVDPEGLIRASLTESEWIVASVQSAGDASRGKRQADAFLRAKTDPIVEVDVRAIRA